MSTLIVEVCTIAKRANHPNADRLRLYNVKGWTIIANNLEDGSPRYQVGDRVVFIPPDAILPLELADKLQVTPYLAKLPLDYVTKLPAGGRVKAARLRGIPSYGVLMAVTPGMPAWEVGTDVKEYFGIEKWEPPLKDVEGDSDREHPFFHRNTSPEHLKNFPNLIPENTEIIVTEKIHGSMCSLSLVVGGDGEWSFMARSMSSPRKEFSANGARSRYWHPMTEDMKAMLQHITESKLAKLSVVVCGELFGAGVQDMQYGRKGLDYAVFDIAVDGEFLNFTETRELCNTFNIQTVPVLYEGPFNLKKVEELTYGPTTVCDPALAGKFKGKEGIVITPTNGLKDICGNRVTLKNISCDYIERKGATDSH